MARRRPSLDRDWEQATTAVRLLSVLFPDHRTPETPGVRRRLRLVLCGAARTVWDRLPHDDLRAAVEVAERFADDQASRRELTQAAQMVRQFVAAAERSWRRLAEDRHTTDHQFAAAAYQATAAELVLACCERSVTVARIAGQELAQTPKLAAPQRVWDECRVPEWYKLEVGPDPAAAVVRDIFGHPAPPQFADGWKSPTVLALTAGIAADAGFDRLPVLADALEDAGCEDERVLGHCRGPGPHWRGCWVVDGLAGR